MDIFSKKTIAVVIVLGYVSAISWFGFKSELLIFERVYYLCLVLGFLFVVVGGRSSYLFPYQMWILCAWMVWCVLGALTAIDQSLVLSRLFTVITRLIISFMIIQLVVRYRLFNQLLMSFVLATMLLAPFCILYPEKFSDLGGRMYGLTGNANSFGIQVTATLLACTYFYSNGRGLIRKLIWIVCSSTCVYLILATGSRKAIFGVLVLFGVFSFFEYKKLSKISSIKALKFTVLAVFASTIFIIGIVNSEHYHRIERVIAAFGEDGSYDDLGDSEKNRIKLIERGIETGLEHPVFGVGLKNFEKVTLGFMNQEIGTYAHSNYVEVFATTGIVGVILYYLIWITTGIEYMSFMRRYPNVASVGLTMLIILLIYDLGGVNYYHKVSWTTMTLMFCCLRPKYILPLAVKRA